jgi:hypothetical protein
MLFVIEKLIERSLILEIFDKEKIESKKEYIKKIQESLLRLRPNINVL